MSPVLKPEQVCGCLGFQSSCWEHSGCYDMGVVELQWEVESCSSLAEAPWAPFGITEDVQGKAPDLEILEPLCPPYLEQASLSVCHYN